jgi:hypothetical protein
MQEVIVKTLVLRAEPHLDLHGSATAVESAVAAQFPPLVFNATVYDRVHKIENCAASAHAEVG